MSVLQRVEHIVLDLDGTLIGEDHICARPHLSTFLKYLFSNFETVNIWTRASKDWWTFAFEKFIKRHMPPDQDEFHRVWTFEHCKRDGEGRTFKPLSKYWRRKWGMKRHNTILIDNDPENWHYDPKNGLKIATYLGASQDTELLRIINVLNTNICYGFDPQESNLSPADPDYKSDSD